MYNRVQFLADLKTTVTTTLEMVTSIISHSSMKKLGNIQEMCNIFYDFLYFTIFIWILVYISNRKNNKDVSKKC